MSDIIKMELELKRAKEQEKQNKIEAQLDINRSFIGKCYSTHTFRRNRKSTISVTYKIVDVEYDGSNYCYVVELIEYRLIDGYKTFQYITKSIVTHHSFAPGMKEISLERFEAIKQTTLEYLNGISIRIDDLTQLQELQDGGEEDDYRKQNLVFDDVPTIDLKDRLDLVRTLINERFPYLIGHKVLIEYSIPVLNSIIKRTSKHREIWRHAYERDTKTIKELKEVIKLIENYEQ